MKTIGLLAAFVATGWLACQSRAEDWPTYGHDNRRSHVTGESLTLPLKETWIRRSPVPPQTAWTGPAKWDAFAGNEGLQSMRNFDPVFFVTAVGEKVFFGSSVDNAAHCLDAGTGEEAWVAFTGSAVRLPPTWHDDRVFFSSDDGYAYCVDAATGEEHWRYRPIEDPRLIPSNGKLMSRWPVRTGVLVDGGLAYFAGSLFPWAPSYVCAVDAKTGRKHFVEEQTGVTLQGALLASSARLFAPQGRSVPLVFAKATGSPLGNVGGTGGVYCILTEEEQLISMPHNQKSREEVVKVTDTESKQSLLTVSGANRMLVAGSDAFFHQRTDLKAIDRHAAIRAQGELSTREAELKRLGKELSELKKAKTEASKIAAMEKRIAEVKGELPAWKEAIEKAERWRVTMPVPSALILAGDHLFLGGDGEVSAVTANEGSEVWKAQVEGRVYGLAVANGRLFLSTDRGHIYAFGASR